MANKNVTLNERNIVTLLQVLKTELKWSPLSLRLPVPYDGSLGRYRICRSPAGCSMPNP